MSRWIKSELFIVRRLWFNRSRMIEHPPKSIPGRAPLMRGRDRVEGAGGAAAVSGHVSGRAAAHPYLL